MWGHQQDGSPKTALKKIAARRNYETDLQIYRYAAFLPQDTHAWRRTKGAAIAPGGGPTLGSFAWLPSQLVIVKIQL